jgi:SAM-dependent methyltransferase
MFSDYLYMSSVSETMLGHARAICETVTQRESLGPDATVVEIGSNDGYLLQYFLERGCRVLGIDPAENLADIARGRGIPTRTDFFSAELAHALLQEDVRPDVLIGNNVLAHVPDLRGLAEGVAVLLQPHGVAIFEVPYLRALIDKGEFDTIYHEHVFYFSVTALASVFSGFGLAVEDVELIDIHGGSLRVWLRAAEQAEPSTSVAELLEAEEKWVTDPETYSRCRDRFFTLRTELRDLLSGIRKRGDRIAAYGAAAKGTMLTNLFGIGGDTLEFVADMNELKQGRFMPGSHVPIVSPDRLVDEMPEFCLLLVWNLLDEIRNQEREYLSRGGRLILPVPEPEVL